MFNKRRDIVRTHCCPVGLVFIVGVIVIVSAFLVADTKLYKRLCPSLGPSVGRSVRPLVREHESKSGKMSVLKRFVYVSVLERVLGGVLGVDRGWLPLPTRPQRYCDPASLVSSNEFFVIGVLTF